jgi:hypothetical protein
VGDWFRDRFELGSAKGAVRRPWCWLLLGGVLVLASALVHDWWRDFLMAVGIGAVTVGVIEFVVLPYIESEREDAKRRADAYWELSEAEQLLAEWEPLWPAASPFERRALRRELLHAIRSCYGFDRAIAERAFAMAGTARYLEADVDKIVELTNEIRSTLRAMRTRIDLIDGTWLTAPSARS